MQPRSMCFIVLSFIHGISQKMKTIVAKISNYKMSCESASCSLMYQVQVCKTWAYKFKLLGSDGFTHRPWLRTPGLLGPRTTPS